MSQLDEWSPPLSVRISRTDIEDTKASLNKHFWTWYDEHKNDVILRVLFWTRRVSDLRPLFVMLFGEPR